MTGHGLAEAEIGGSRVTLEVRAVNHRYFDARVRLPVELAQHASAVEERARKSLRRGRVEVSGRLDGDVAGPPELDVERARSAFEQLCALRDDLRPEESVPLSLLASVPDLFRAKTTHDVPLVQETLASVMDAACEQVWEMRRREGAALAEALETHLDALLTQLAFIRDRVERVVSAHRDKLHKRIERLLADRDVELDPGRLEHEVALLADRADIAEEIARLDCHATQLRELLHTEDESAGKRLDFLLQEMSRETNTIGSKGSDAELARAVVEMKAAISRMREQAQNVL